LRAWIFRAHFALISRWRRAGFPFLGHRYESISRGGFPAWLTIGRIRLMPGEGIIRASMAPLIRLTVLAELSGDNIIFELKVPAGMRQMSRKSRL
jgi:hypothetical protein